MALKHAPDLTKQPPRSARVRLGGYAVLPRMLDKGRAAVNGNSGEYHYNCPLDQRILGFLGIDADALKEQLAAGKGDAEILEWIEKNGKHKHNPVEIKAWSDFAEQRVPQDNESRGYFSEMLGKIAPKREDIGTWFELLDLDDYATFGGKP